MRQDLMIALHLAAADLRGKMQYRADFVAQVTVGVVWQCTSFLFLWVVLSRFQSLAGWTLGAVAFLYALRLSAHAVNSIFFFPLAFFSWQVRRGDFDRYLARPLPPLLQIVSSNISLVIFGDTLSAVLLLVAAVALARIDWSPLGLLYLVLSIVGGGLVEAALQLFAASLSFRFLNTDAVGEFLDSLFANFGNYPLTIYGNVLRVVLTFVVPIAFVAYFPAAVLLDRTGELSVPSLVAYLAPLAGVLWFAAAYAFFVHELRHYQSSGH